jgi:hypothetical protein
MLVLFFRFEITPIFVIVVVALFISSFDGRETILQLELFNLSAYNVGSYDILNLILPAGL